MKWDIPHHRGSGFPLHILRGVGVYTVLYSLARESHLRPADLKRRLSAAYALDAPIMGAHKLPGGLSLLLGHLRRAGLTALAEGGSRGAHTRYDLTALGAGLIAAIAPLTEWAMSDFGFLVDATRIRLGLPRLPGPPPPLLRNPRTATNMAIGLSDGLWTHTLLVYVDSAGEAGIGPLRLEDTINADIARSAGDAQVVRRLHRGTLHPALQHLVAMGLLEQREAPPPRTPYVLTGHARGLMGALWQIADTWGIAHDEQLFPIVRETSGWFAKPEIG